MTNKTCIAIIGLLILAPSVQEAQQVEKIFQSIVESKGSNLDSATNDLIGLGASAIESVREGLKRADSYVRIAAANFLYHYDQHEEAVNVLLGVVKDAKDSGTARAAAKSLASHFETGKKLEKQTRELFDKNVKTAISKAKDELTKVLLYKVSYLLTQNLAAERALKDILKTGSKEVKTETAFALAEIGSVINENAMLKEALKEIARESGDKGRIARCYLRIGDLEKAAMNTVLHGEELNQLRDENKKLKDENKQLQEGTEQLRERIDKLVEQIRELKSKLPKEPKDKEPKDKEKSKEKELPNVRSEQEDRYKLLDEIIERLKNSYQDPQKIDIDKLIEKAAKGIVESLDPFSTYYQKDEFAKIQKETMEGKYGGIGARVAMRRDRNGNAWLTITEPFFSGPAFKSGLRSGDRIVEIEGETTANQDLEELVRRLRGDPGTKVNIKYQRYGFEKPRPLEIVREQIHIDSVYAEMLPGKIGLISLRRFGRDDDKEFAKAIESLQEKEMKAMIVDLRGNPGGLLDTCLNIIDLFLDSGEVMVIIKTKDEEQRRFTKTKPKTDVPVIVLVDGGSASASEILSGALKVHGRAKVVGEKTFGKGSVQQTYLCQATDKKSAVKFTVSKWLLPNGKPVDNEDRAKAGVFPDFEVSFPERDPWVDKEIEKLRESQAIEKYIFDNFDKNKELFEKLAQNDKRDASLYPNFDDYYKSLNTKLEKEHVRKALRDQIRQKVAEEKKKLFLTDTEEDVQLQRAISEVAKVAKLDLSKIEEYGFFLKPSQNQ